MFIEKIGDGFSLDTSEVKDPYSEYLTDVEAEEFLRSGKAREHGINLDTYASDKKRVIAPVPFSMMTDAEKADVESQVIAVGKYKGMTKKQAVESQKGSQNQAQAQRQR